MKMKKNKYDVIVIGGGPAGMMAAGRAAESGARVILLEKNDRLGRKLLITGKYRCNLTHAVDDVQSFIEALGKQGKFLYPALHAFGVNDIIAFFHRLGVQTKVERGSRVFPVSDKALDVRNALADYIKKAGVEAALCSPVKKIIFSNGHIEKIILADKELSADRYILCTGGLSYRETGCTGDGYKWLEKAGHTIITPRPALVGVLMQEKWVRDVQGLDLKNVRVTIYQNNKKADERFGEALFTHKGISGPVVLDMSKKIGELCERGPVEMRIDLKPALHYKKLDDRLQRDFQKARKKMLKNSLDDLLPQRLIPIILQLSRIDPDKPAYSLKKEERKKLLHLLKDLKLNVKSIDGFDKAVITSGGIDLKEIDPKTMRSKIIKNLFLAGEILDLDGPTGGFNLQICWSTGYLAGKSTK